VAAAFREESGRLAASVTRVLGDFEAAQEVVQDALLAAWEQWPVEGVPDRPGAWLWTVARRRAVDVLRRNARLREKLAEAAWPVEQGVEDDRLRLVFTCCHPALSQEAQVALTLRTVCGLSTAEIASAFLVSESAIIQRLTRARRTKRPPRRTGPAAHRVSAPRTPRRPRRFHKTAARISCSPPPGTSNNPGINSTPSPDIFNPGQQRRQPGSASGRTISHGVSQLVTGASGEQVRPPVSIRDRSATPRRPSCRRRRSGG